MRELNYKNENDIVTPIEIEESVIFGIEDHSKEIGSCWLRFTVGINLNSCSYLGPLYFNTSSDQLLKLAKNFERWAATVSILESSYKYEEEQASKVKLQAMEQALAKLTDEEKKLLGLDRIGLAKLTDEEKKLLGLDTI